MDVILGAFITARGGDPFGSAKKLGGGHREPADLSPAELADYLAPFLGTARAYPDARCVLLHDGLPPEVTECVPVPASFAFEFVGDLPARHTNYDRRLFAFRDWLAAHPEAAAVWCVDVNDVAFTTHPFGWLAAYSPAGLASGEEWTPYGRNPWFQGAWPHLPPRYGDLMGGDCAARHPVTVGNFGGPRAVVLDVLAAVCREVDAVRDHLDRHPPPHPIMADMHAFAAVVLPLAGVTTFKMDGATPTDRGTPSPLIHDRATALAHLRARTDPLGQLRAALRHTQRLPGWCPDAKADAMAQLVLDTRPAVCVEIGVFGGRSLLAQALALRQNGRGVIYGVDPWTRAPSLEGYQFGPDTHRQAWTEETLTDVYAGALAATVALGLAAHVRLLCSPSQHVAEAFAPGSIDILHIDGNHSEGAAIRDVDNYLHRVRPRGWVWVDDTDWDSVRPALALIEESCRLVTDAGRWRLYQRGDAP